MAYEKFVAAIVVNTATAAAFDAVKILLPAVVILLLHPLFIIDAITSVFLVPALAGLVGFKNKDVKKLWHRCAATLYSYYSYQNKADQMNHFFSANADHLVVFNLFLPYYIPVIFHKKLAIENHWKCS